MIEQVDVNTKVSAQTTDVHYGYQWSLENTGQTSGGVAGADINFKGYLSALKGKTYNKVKVAVIDTGVNYTLADLKDVTDTTNDYDFVNNDNDAKDDNSHGTHVSGIIASSNNNQYSMSGISSYATILPIKVLNAKGEGNWADLALGIKYAADQGVKVINMSLGGTISDKSKAIVEEQLKYASNKGVTIVVAAGNDGKNEVSYPASSAYSIAVGATDNKDQLASYSNSGKGLDIVAPGSAIPSLVATGQVYLKDGTSMAAPHVAAVAATILAMAPGITPNKVEEILKTTAKDLGAKGPDSIFGSGRLDAGAAIQKVLKSGDIIAPTFKLLSDVNDTSTIIQGVLSEQGKVEIYIDSKLLAKGDTDKSGNFKITIPKQKVGTKLSMRAKDLANNQSLEVIKVVTDGRIPIITSVKDITTKSTFVEGTVNEPGDIQIILNNKVIATGKTDSKGNFKIPIIAQKVGIKIYVKAIDKANNVSKLAEKIVKP